MRILRPIVETVTDLVPIRDSDFNHRHGKRTKTVGDDDPRSAVFLHDPLRSFSAAALSRFAVTTASKTCPSRSIARYT
jgi:hypothetical protein